RAHRAAAPSRPGNPPVHPAPRFRRPRPHGFRKPGPRKVRRPLRGLEPPQAQGAGKGESRAEGVTLAVSRLGEAVRGEEAPSIRNSFLTSPRRALRSERLKSGRFEGDFPWLR